MRLDSELVRRGLAQSRERAKEYILAGMVTVNGRAAQKPSDTVSEGDEISVTGQTLKYVGRGGLKLEHALKVFGINLSGLTCLDIGASTGGFTDCMLQSGAAFVFCTDVGHGQLAEKLKNDPRVENIEGINVKDIVAETFSRKIDFVSADLSFISCRYAAEAADRVLSDGGEAVLLIKPQFEAGRKNISKGGIVKDMSVHIKILEELTALFSASGFEIKGLAPSPIRGGDGNIEYLVHLVKQKDFTPLRLDISAVCGEAFTKMR